LRRREENGNSALVFISGFVGKKLRMKEREKTKEGERKE